MICRKKKITIITGAESEKHNNNSSIVYIERHANRQICKGIFCLTLKEKKIHWYLTNICSNF